MICVCVYLRFKQWLNMIWKQIGSVVSKHSANFKDAIREEMGICGKSFQTAGFAFSQLPDWYLDISEGCVLFFKSIPPSPLDSIKAQDVSRFDERKKFLWEEMFSFRFQKILKHNFTCFTQLLTPDNLILWKTIWKCCRLYT